MSFVLLGILNSQAAGGIEPAFLSDAPLWLDAADASTITESAGSVSQWDNKGTLENFSQGSSSFQPTTGVSTVNGLNVLDFSTDFLTGATKSQWKFLHDGTEWFYVAAMATDAAIGNNSVFGNKRQSSANVGMDFAQRGSYFFQVASGNSGNLVINVVDSSFFQTSDFLISSALVRPSESAADRLEYYENETEGTVSNSANTSVSSSDPTFNLDIGASGDGLYEMNGQIGELIIVSGADATETNRQIVVEYLNDKWGVF